MHIYACFFLIEKNWKKKITKSIQDTIKSLDIHFPVVQRHWLGGGETDYFTFSSAI